MPVSCCCICDLITRFRTTYVKITDFNEKGKDIYAEESGGVTIIGGMGKNNYVLVGTHSYDDLRGAKDTNPPGGRQKGAAFVRDPQWLILAHELCGHAANDTDHPKDKTAYTLQDPTIQKENQIRQEHSTGDDNYGVRYGTP
jgi:hypothetical protein